jgi:multiple sugar transport system ATP-binding protein
LSLILNNLSKTLGSKRILENISLEVQDGEFLVVLGPSGGGKSTLLRLICGLESPDSGQIQLSGRDITGLQPRERNLGMVFQDYGLYPNMDVYGNVAYGLENQGLPRAEVEKRVREALEKVNMTEHLRKNITELSGGEQQRVALARAMSRDAEAFLFDEPLSNLDPKLRHSARQDIMRLHRLKKKPSVYVTHDQLEAHTMADRIALIAHGRLQQIGSPQSLLERPENLFVARFVGSPPMNLLQGQLEGDSSLRFVAGLLALELGSDLSARFSAWTGKGVVMGVRPEHLSLEGNEDAEDLFALPTSSETDPENSWENSSARPDPLNWSAHLTALEPLIGEIGAHLNLGGVEVYAVFPDTGREWPALGQCIDLRIKPDSLVFFDVETGLAL